MQSILTFSKTKIVQLQGSISTENAAAIKQQLAEMVSAQEYSSLMLDMSLVSALDSAGLMVLVATLTLAQGLNKSFGLFGISPAVRIVFELTQLDRVFEISESPAPELELVAA
jgi:anti-sigma B factor antagonist